MRKAHAFWLRMEANLVDRSNDLSFEQLLTCRDLPFLVLGRELDGSKMTDHTGHGNGTIAPWLSEGEIKLVVFDIWITWDGTLIQYDSGYLSFGGNNWKTYGIDTASCKMVSDGLRDRRLLCHAEYPRSHQVAMIAVLHWHS